MTSAAQIDANRANAQNSTGPATATGKATSRFNATRHGLTSQVACMTWEDREAFNTFCTALIADYRPEGAAETQLAQAIAEDNWRLNRARAIEHNIFALGFAASAPLADSDNPQIDAALAQAQTFRDEAKTFGLITLYEQRIHRNLQRNFDRLRQLQSERRLAARKLSLNSSNKTNGTKPADTWKFLPNQTPPFHSVASFFLPMKSTSPSSAAAAPTSESQPHNSPPHPTNAT